ncbi:MAG: DUF934 domain-containing protein [Proteobacteria bacterium]|nr:DUF934 domain-containing protein [Pseudomonadota bacterium]
MALIKDGAFVDDPWVAVGDDPDLPAGAPVVVGLDRWQRDRDSLLGRNGPLGIRLRSDQSPATVAADLGRFALVALEFPKFTDGRAYSYARLLRERYGFKGEVRAVGNVLRDQISFMRRCGFDAFEVPERAREAGWLRNLAGLSVVYQRAADGRRPASVLRRTEDAAAEGVPTQPPGAGRHRASSTKSCLAAGPGLGA